MNLQIKRHTYIVVAPLMPLMPRSFVRGIIMAKSQLIHLLLRKAFSDAPQEQKEIPERFLSQAEFQTGLHEGDDSNNKVSRGAHAQHEQEEGHNQTECDSSDRSVSGSVQYEVSCLEESDNSSLGKSEYDFLDAGCYTNEWDEDEDGGNEASVSNGSPVENYSLKDTKGYDAVKNIDSTTGAGVKTDSVRAYGDNCHSQPVVEGNFLNFPDESSSGKQGHSKKDANEKSRLRRELRENNISISSPQSRSDNADDIRDNYCGSANTNRNQPCDNDQVTSDMHDEASVPSTTDCSYNVVSDINGMPNSIRSSLGDGPHRSSIKALDDMKNGDEEACHGTKEAGDAYISDEHCKRALNAGYDLVRKISPDNDDASSDTSGYQGQRTTCQ